MSRLTDLLSQARLSDPQLGAALEEEVSALLNRRSFGLVFERHLPEAVELPHQRPRRGSKVRVLPPRGETKPGDQRLWRVLNVDGDEVSLQELGAEVPEEQRVPVSDVVVVAEFQDTIYPGLVETGEIERAEGKPFHTVINGENFHALQMLTYTHRHKVDVIYIDPPYNTGDGDWKYNNKFVAKDDNYRHSKWLSFMEKRLLLARELLNPDDSVLIVTIDEKEYLRLGLLLEQTFPEATIQMVTSVISPQGSARGKIFKRSEEYIYFVFFGASFISPLPLSEEWNRARESKTVRGAIHWASLKRTGTNASRADRPGMFYPVFLSKDATKFVGVGDPLPQGASRDDVDVPVDCVAVWPIRRDGSEGRWQLMPETFVNLQRKGYVKLGRPNGPDTAVSYLKAGEQKKVASGEYKVIGKRQDGSIITEGEDTSEKGNASYRPTTVWDIRSHSAGHHGSNLINAMIPGRSFPFPKSLYAVEDTLRFVVHRKPEAIVLDFFCGSGTTAHAVMRLNKQDGGRRQSISVTNNEVSIEEQSRLLGKGLRHGDAAWEALGICDYVTKPRIRAAISGVTPEGKPIKGDYGFTDEFPMADGLEENARFFTLTYESPIAVRHAKSFTKIAPLLWLRAGASGRIISSLGTKGWDVTDSYAVIERLGAVEEFMEELSQHTSVRTVFVISDDDSAYQMVARELPENAEVVRLYESYLQNFEISQGVVL